MGRPPATETVASEYDRWLAERNRWPRLYWVNFGTWAACTGLGNWERVYLTRRKPKPLAPGGRIEGAVTINVTTGEAVTTSRWTPLIRTYRWPKAEPGAR